MKEKTTRLRYCKKEKGNLQLNDLITSCPIYWMIPKFYAGVMLLNHNKNKIKINQYGNNNNNANLTRTLKRQVKNVTCSDNIT